MTTQEIQDYIAGILGAHFTGYSSDAFEMMASDGGDGRFFGRVTATRYTGLPGWNEMYLAIGLTEKQTQIVKFGHSECLNPSTTELDVLFLKELGIEPKDGNA